jgi:hypothetical protein
MSERGNYVVSSIMGMLVLVIGLYIAGKLLVRLIEATVEEERR